jgi:hypothetical protein
MRLTGSCDTQGRQVGVGGDGMSVDERVSGEVVLGLIGRFEPLPAHSFGVGLLVGLTVVMSDQKQPFAPDLPLTSLRSYPQHFDYFSVTVSQFVVYRDADRILISCAAIKTAPPCKFDEGERQGS